MYEITSDNYEILENNKVVGLYVISSIQLCLRNGLRVHQRLL